MRIRTRSLMALRRLMVWLNLYRHSNHKPRPALWLVLYRDCSVVHFDEPLDDRKAKTGSAGPRPGNPVEFLEDLRQRFGGKSGTVVGHDDHQIRPFDIRPDLNSCAFGGVQGSIMQKVRHRLFKEAVIDLHQGSLR